jgi:hypothetical protein
MILINPPIVKPSEPPAGLAALAGALGTHGMSHAVVDGNIEAILWLIGKGPLGPFDTFTRRAWSRLAENLAFLRSWKGYAGNARYRRAISEVNRILERSGPPGTRLSLADYNEDRFSPVKSSDLLHAALHHEENAFYPYFRERFSGLLADSKQDVVVGLSLNYLSQAVCAFAIAGFVRLRCPRAKIVMGGGLVSAWMSSSTWANPFDGLIDHFVSGPGESFLLSLAGIEAAGTDYCPSLDGLPLSSYLAPGPILPYAASRGCYWRRCSFCPEKAQGARFSFRPSSQVVADLALLSEKHNPVLIHLVDNAVSPALMAAMIASPPPAPWYGFARITPELADRDFCVQLRASGCVMLKLGLESGDQDLLDALGKGTSLDVAAKALSALKEAGIGTYVYLLFGTPMEDLSRARKSLSFVASHSASIDFINLAVFNLPVDCEEAKGLDVRPFYGGDLSLYTDFVHPRDFGRREVRKFLDREFKTHPAIRPILLRRPPLFTSNHAPFFCTYS